MESSIQAILPTQDITSNLSEVIVERDITDVSYETLLSVVVEAASVVEDSNFYEPYDSVSNALSGMSLEYDEVTMNKIRLDEVEGLEGDICGLAVKLAKRLKRTGISDMGHAEHLPLVEMTDMTNAGDLIVNIKEMED